MSFIADPDFRSWAWEKSESPTRVLPLHDPPQIIIWLLYHPTWSQPEIILEKECALQYKQNEEYTVIEYIKTRIVSIQTK
jgi:hypothetical protein